MTQIAESTGRGIEIVCHRGANEHAPENTYAAAQLCIEWGMDYVEIDVNRSRDGVHYIFHGPALEATTNGSGFFNQLTSSEIDQLDAGSWFDPRFAGERVPRLEPFLAWVKGKAKLFLDVKAADMRELIGMIYAFDLQDECFFWFENPDHARQLRATDRQLSLKVNVRSVADVIAAHEELAANIVELGLAHMSDELVTACRARGIRIMIYHQDKDPLAFRQILAWRADLVNLNHCDLFAAVAAEYAQEQSQE